MTSLAAIIDARPLVEWTANPKALPSASFDDAYPLARSRVLKAKDVIAGLPGYAETALKTLDTAAGDLGVGALYYKDESTRFRLGSFKSLGGAYAVLGLVEKEGAGVTVCAATAGNHGRSVSFGAKMAGVPCHIFISESVSEGRAEAMRALGAEVHRVKGNYEDSLAACLEAAEAGGWHIVSDTAFPGYQDIPLAIMQGYGVMVEELAGQMPEPLGNLTHVFLQAGCGGFAGAVMASILNHTGEQRPKFVLVEPENVACVLESVKAGEMKAVGGDHKTWMGGMACGEVSLVAWPLLRDYGDFVLSITDDALGVAMTAMAKGTLGGGKTQAGESGVAGLIAAVISASDKDLRKSMGIDADSKILVIGTEGATDPETYEHLTGLKP